MDNYADKFVKAIKKAKEDSELYSIVDKVYSDGYEDGLEDAGRKTEEYGKASHLKEIIYHIKGEKEARKLQENLREVYEDVNLYPNGTEDYRVICTLKA